jgi:hypothetical protein
MVPVEQVSNRPGRGQDLNSSPTRSDRIGMRISMWIGMSEGGEVGISRRMGSGDVRTREKPSR